MSILPAILSNCVFLVGHQPVVTYLKVIFIKGMFIRGIENEGNIIVGDDIPGKPQ